MEVYCNHCKFSKSEDYTEDSCAHPNNMIKYSTPKSYYYGHQRTIFQLNMNNDCTWYERWWVYSIIEFGKTILKKIGVNFK